MIRWKFRFAALCVCVLTSCNLAAAGSLTISPILIEAPEGQTATTLTLHNRGTKPLQTQVRIFAWRQVNGEDVLETTNAVVASPPMIEIKPGTEYTVRILRLSKAPVNAEESYRVIVDEVPDAYERRNGMVALALRYVVPVFFFAGERRPPRLTWSIMRYNNAPYLVARNEGDRRLRIAELSLGNMRVASGLAGYVLGNSERWWKLDQKLAVSNRRVTADSDLGRISEVAK
jgi:fimbrial chaperone protein